jgi:hypothetical protein
MILGIGYMANLKIPLEVRKENKLVTHILANMMPVMYKTILGALKPTLVGER